MKSKLFTVIVGAALCLAAARGLAQTGTGTNATTTPSRTTTTRVISDTEVKENISPTDAASNTRPPRQERPALSSEVKDRLRAFEKARETYLERQRELEKRWKGATEQERERIREQLKDRRRAWLEQHKQFNEDMRERLREIKRELPSLRRALEENRPATRPGLD